MIFGVPFFFRDKIIYFIEEKVEGIKMSKKEITNEEILRRIEELEDRFQNLYDHVIETGKIQLDTTMSLSRRISNLHDYVNFLVNRK